MAEPNYPFSMWCSRLGALVPVVLLVVLVLLGYGLIFATIGAAIYLTFKFTVLIVGGL